MSSSNFLRGMGMGIAVGAAAGALLPKRKRGIKKSAAARAVKAATEVMENLSDVMGM